MNPSVAKTISPSFCRAFFICLYFTDQEKKKKKIHSSCIPWFNFHKHLPGSQVSSLKPGLFSPENGIIVLHSVLIKLPQSFCLHVYITWLQEEWRKASLFSQLNRTACGGCSQLSCCLSFSLAQSKYYCLLCLRDKEWQKEEETQRLDVIFLSPFILSSLVLFS